VVSPASSSRASRKIPARPEPVSKRSLALNGSTERVFIAIAIDILQITGSPKKYSTNHVGGSLRDPKCASRRDATTRKWRGLKNGSRSGAGRQYLRYEGMIPPSRRRLRESHGEVAGILGFPASVRSAVARGGFG